MSLALGAANHIYLL